jgi:hypothetical protein
MFFTVEIIFKAARFVGWAFMEALPRHGEDLRNLPDLSPCQKKAAEGGL